jgi:hypothetical protein
LPEFKSTTRINWQEGPMTLSLRWRWIDSVTDDQIKLGGRDPATMAAPFTGSINYFDLTSSFLIHDAYTVTFDIENVLDETPVPPPQPALKPSPNVRTLRCSERRLAIAETFSIQFHRNLSQELAIRSNDIEEVLERKNSPASHPDHKCVGIFPLDIDVNQSVCSEYLSGHRRIGTLQINPINVRNGRPVVCLGHNGG